MPSPRSTALHGLLLAGAALALALVSNGLASPARRLAWTRGPLFPAPAPAPRMDPPPSLPAPAPPPPQAPAPAPLRGPRPAPLAPVPPAPVPPPPEPRPPIREISGQEAWEAFQAGAPFLDARRSAEYAEGHIARAWCAPLWESDLDDRLLQFKAARRPGPEDPIVIYCSGGDCRDSHLLASKLVGEGYFHLLIYRDGFPAWLSQGRPVEKGQP